MATQRKNKYWTFAAGSPTTNSVDMGACDIMRLYCPVMEATTAKLRLELSRDLTINADTGEWATPDASAVWYLPTDKDGDYIEYPCTASPSTELRAPFYPPYGVLSIRRCRWHAYTAANVEVNQNGQIIYPELRELAR